MKSTPRTVNRIERGKGWLCRAFPLVVLLLFSLGGTHAQEDIVVTIDRFLLRLGPKQDDFSLQKKVTVLWTIENLVREYFESLYADSQETIFKGAGITGLSVVPPEEESPSYETVKFLGGAVTFDGASQVTPSQGQMQGHIQQALHQDVVIARLQMYFPTLNAAIFVPLGLGNRGFASDMADEAEEEEPGSDMEDGNYEKPVPKPTVADQTGGSGSVDAISGQPDNGQQANEIQASQSSTGNSNKTTVGLSTGVALGGAIIVLLIALLIQSRRRRMDFWRESRRDSESSHSIEDDHHPRKEKPGTPNGNRYYMEDDQETSLRLPRIWGGVTPSRRMDATTPGSSDVSASNEGDSVQEILTCTSMDRRSIQNVESFEHQKRLVDTLKKEMMASNAEIHPYIQDTHLDNTEPCALSPTDLSAAALENNEPSRPVPTWHAPSDSSFTGSGSGSGYDSPTSPLRVMMRTLQMSASRHQPPSNRRNRSPYEPDSVEL